jgi:serine protease Do
MKHPGITALACLGAGLMFASLAPSMLYAQSQGAGTEGSGAASGKATKPEPPPSKLQCDELDSSAEQIAKDARILQQKLQEHLAGMQKELADGELMKSEELAKVQGMAEALSSQGAALDSRATELSARARALAGKAQEQATLLQRQIQEGIAGFDNGSDSGRGWLGIEINEVTADSAKELKLPAVRGVMVEGVAPDSPAEKAGLKEKDVITQYDGQVVEGTLQFRRLVRETPPGRSVNLSVLRDGNPHSMTIVVGELTSSPETEIRGSANNPETFYLYSPPDMQSFSFGPDSMERSTPKLGIEAEDLNGQLGAYFGAPGNTGILVREVREGSPAEKAGLKAGDVITQVDGKAVHTLAELQEELRSKADEKSVSVAVLRKGAAMNVSVAIEKPQPATTSHLVRRAQM